MEFTQHMDVEEIKEEDMKPSNLYKNYSGASELFFEIEELKEKMFWEDADKHMTVGSDIGNWEEYENDINGDLPYTSEELAEIFEEINDEKKKKFNNPKDHNKP